MRINAFLAAAGLGSRRSVESLVREGRVTVNGSLAHDLASRVDPEKDLVVCDGKPVRLSSFRYVLLNKPAGYACTRSDPHLKRTIYELLPEGTDLKYAGRLDVDSEGMVLLSNDGQWLNAISHPRHEIAKTYEVEVEGAPSEEDLKKICAGIRSRDEVLRAKEVRFLEKHEADSRLRLILMEGKNREIRRMFDGLNHPVRRLTRVAVGSLTLGDLKSGQWRELNASEAALFQKPKQIP